MVFPSGKNYNAKFCFHFRFYNSITGNVFTKSKINVRLKNTTLLYINKLKIFYILIILQTTSIFSRNIPANLYNFHYHVCRMKSNSYSAHYRKYIILNTPVIGSCYTIYVPSPFDAVCYIFFFY